MAAIRTVLESINSKGQQDFEIRLDCWRLTCWFSPVIFDWRWNGNRFMDMVTNFSYTAPANPTLGASNIVVGGLSIDGKPVNLNDTWRFTHDQPALLASYGFVLKEYYDVNLPDPTKG